MNINLIVGTQVIKASDSYLKKMKAHVTFLNEPDNLKLFFQQVFPVSTNHELIRIGGDSDGGYLVPDDLENISACFSPGVDTTANFENELTQKGIKCFLADYSVEKAPMQNDLFSFTKKYLGNRNDEVFMTLESWVNNSNISPEKDLLLQMDIEGSEYDVLLESSEDTLNKFRIMVIEFHDLEKYLMDRLAFKVLDNTFRKLLKNFSIVHIHPNNYFKPVKYKEFEIPPFLEFTFLRNDRISNSYPTKSFPHKLDQKNVEDKVDFSLPKCWYSN